MMGGAVLAVSARSLHFAASSVRLGALDPGARASLLLRDGPNVVGCAHRVEEVGVLRVSVGVGRDALGYRLLPLVVVGPLFVSVMTLRRLEALEHRLVIADDAGQILNSNFAIQRVVLVHG